MRPAQERQQAQKKWIRLKFYFLMFLVNILTARITWPLKNFAGNQLRDEGNKTSKIHCAILPNNLDFRNYWHSQISPAKVDAINFDCHRDHLCPVKPTVLLWFEVRIVLPIFVVFTCSVLFVDWYWYRLKWPYQYSCIWKSLMKITVGSWCLSSFSLSTLYGLAYGLIRARQRFLLKKH